MAPNRNGGVGLGPGARCSPESSRVSSSAPVVMSRIVCVPSDSLGPPPRSRPASASGASSLRLSSGRAVVVPVRETTGQTIRAQSATGRESALTDENRQKTLPQVSRALAPLTSHPIPRHKRLSIRRLWVRAPRGPALPRHQTHCLALGDVSCPLPVPCPRLVHCVDGSQQSGPPGCLLRCGCRSRASASASRCASSSGVMGTTQDVPVPLAGCTILRLPRY